MYQQDRAMADSYESQVLSILRLLIRHLVVLAVAPAEEDNKQATDFMVKMVGGAIAVRLRRHPCNYRDLTIRARRDNGSRTELAKIRAGYASRYFYGWLDKSGAIAEWVLVDLDKVRATGLLEKPRHLIPNGDGTHFISISVQELTHADCLLASHLLTEVAA